MREYVMKNLIKALALSAIVVASATAIAGSQQPPTPAACTIQGIQYNGVDDIYVWGTGAVHVDGPTWLREFSLGIPFKRADRDWQWIDRNGFWIAKVDISTTFVPNIFTGTLGNFEVQQRALVRGHPVTVAVCDSGLQLISVLPASITPAAVDPNATLPAAQAFLNSLDTPTQVTPQE
jgi:hypothetical protein